MRKKAELYWTLYDKIKEILAIYQIEELFGAGLELGDWDGIRQFEEFAKKESKKITCIDYAGKTVRLYGNRGRYDRQPYYG